MISIDRIERIRADGVEYDVADGRLSVHVEPPPVEPPPVEPPPELPPPEPPPVEPPPSDAILVKPSDNLLSKIAQNPGRTLVLQDGEYGTLILPQGSNGGDVLIQAEHDRKAIFRKVAGFAVSHYHLAGLWVPDAAGYAFQFGTTGDGSSIDAYSHHCSLLRCYGTNSGNDTFKLSQSHDMLLEDCEANGSKQDLFDAVAVNDSVWRRCVGRSTGEYGFILKGGSIRCVLDNVLAENIGKDAVRLGQWTDPEWFNPGFNSFGASFCQVIGGTLRDCGGYSLRFGGAIDCVARGVTMHRRAISGALVAVTVNDRVSSWKSRRILIDSCSFPRSSWLYEDSGSRGATTLINNNPAR